MAPNQVQFSLAGDICLSDLRECCWCLGGQARMLLDIFSVRLTLYTESLIQSFQLCCGWETLYYIKQLRCFHPSVYPSIYSSIYVYIHPSTYLLIYTSIHPSIYHLPSHPFISLSTTHPIWICQVPTMGHVGGCSLVPTTAQKTEFGFWTSIVGYLVFWALQKTSYFLYPQVTKPLHSTIASISPLCVL